jgi:Uma2 family endonuclease
MLCRGLGYECVDGGSTRWEKSGIEKSKEPDCSFYLANEPLVRGMKDIKLDESPPPDLAVEVVIAHPRADAFKVYAALCVPEVWTYDGDSLRFFHLGVDGSYVERDSSLGFPMLRAEEARERLATADEMILVRWTVAIEEWARRELATR